MTHRKLAGEALGTALLVIVGVVPAEKSAARSAIAEGEVDRTTATP